MTRHDTGGVQEYGNKKQATEIGNEVTQKRKWSELPKQALEGREVQELGRPRTGTKTSLMGSK